jgi:hypothetical protein
MARKKKVDEVVDAILEDRAVGPTEPVAWLVGQLFAAFAARGIPGVLDELEQVSDESLLEAVAARLRSGFGRADLADLVLDRLKKIRLDIGDGVAPLEIIGTTLRCLSVKLTVEEVAAASHASLDLYREIEELEAAAKAEAKARKEVIDSLKASAGWERRKALDGAEDRQVQVVIQWDSLAREVVEVRSDTSEVICRRDPTKEEKQRPLPGFGA